MREPVQTEVHRLVDLVLRQPQLDDGAPIWRLIKESETLDLNSPYCYLTLCHHFANTCVVAEDKDALVGFIVGYRPPNAQDIVVVWQIGVAISRRGQGIGLAMLHELLRRDACREVSFLEATVTPSNIASRAIFTALARSLNAQWIQLAGFKDALFPKESCHEAEHLFRIGPFSAEQVQRAIVRNPL